MHSDDGKCGGCGEPLTDGGVDWYCANNTCDYERQMVAKWAAQINERAERETYERLKAKFEPTPIAGE